MERQLELDLTDAAERQRRLVVFLAPLELPARQAAVLCLMAGHGDRATANGQSISTLQISKHQAAELAGVSSNTFAAGVRDLEAAGLMGRLTNTRPWTYVVNWTRLARLEPPPVKGVEALAVCGEVWSGLVRLGQGLRDSVSISNSDPCTVVNRVPCSVNTGPLTEGDQTDQAQAKAQATQPQTAQPQAVSRRRPWAAQGGITDGELRDAVIYGRLSFLRHLYDEAVGLGWIADSEDARLRFLTLCHHVATSSGLHNRMAVLVSRVKQGLDVSRTRHDSEVWAGKALAAGQTRQEVPCG